MQQVTQKHKTIKSASNEGGREHKEEGRRGEDVEESVRP